MAGHRLGRFYEGFSSWRRALAKAETAAQPIVFQNACHDIVGWVDKGLDRQDAMDELNDMADSVSIDTDTAQRMIAKAVMEAAVRHEFEYQGPNLGARLQALADADGGGLREGDDVVVPLRPEQTTNKQRGNGRDAEQQGDIEFQTSGQFLDDLHTPEYLIDGVLQRRFFYSLTGKTGAGKTAVALYIAMCVALGRSIGDLSVTRGSVLYLAGENPDDVRYRWVAMHQQMDVAEQVTLPVWWVTERLKLSSCLSSLHAFASAIGGLSLVIIDTAPAYFEGKETNDQVEMGDYARMLRSLVKLPGGPCVLALCHPVKRAAADDLIPLGAGAFLNEVDGNLTCAVEASAVELHWQGKIRGPDFAPLNFELKSVTHERLVTSTGKAFPTVIARHLSDAAREGIDKAVKGDALLVLAEVKADPGAFQREYATRLGWNLASGKPHFSKVNRAIAKLITAKLITKELDGFALTEKGQKRLEKSGSHARLKKADPSENGSVVESPENAVDQ